MILQRFDAWNQNPYCFWKICLLLDFLLDLLDLLLDLLDLLLDLKFFKILE